MSSIQPSFPFLFLPDEEQLRVARVMDAFTACVIELDPRLNDDSIILTSSNTGNLAHVKRNLLYDGLAFGRQQNHLELFMDNFTMQSWMKLLLYITNCRIVNVFFVRAGYCPFAIRKTFHGMNLNNVTMCPIINRRYTLNVMKQLPTTRGLTYLSNLETKDFLKLAIQNFNGLTAGDQTITLCGLLAVNSVNFVCTASGLKGKDVNRFLKLWTNGSNPRLEHLMLVIDQVWEKPDDSICELTRGIHCQRVKSRYDIFRKDGVKATFWVNTHPDHTGFNMIPFSLCSKKTKELVRLSGRKCRVIHVVFSGRCVINLDPPCGDNPITLTSSNTGNPDSLAHARKNLLYDGLTFGRQQNHLEFFMENFTMQTWMKLLLYITNCRIVNVFFHASGHCSLAIRKTFEGMFLNMVFVFYEQHSLDLMNQLPITRGLNYSSNLETKDFLKLAIQNFDKLIASNQTLTLNDLLAVNSVDFVCTASGLKGKDVNRFLKLWTNGSNARLKRLTLVIDQVWEKRDDSICELTRGIHCQRVRNEDLSSSQEHQSITSGYDIFREDGVKATFWVHTYPDRTGFNMLVWP
ncbi:unnamed protein product [Caenorhabditis brenneri]